MADYITLADLKRFVKDDTTLDDDTMATAITVASRAVDRLCRRHFSQDAAVSAKYFDPENFYEMCFVDRDGQQWDLSTTTGLIVQTDPGYLGTFPQTLTLNTHFYLSPLNGARYGLTGWPYDGLCMLINGGLTLPPAAGGYLPTVKVTGKWGWAAVPDGVKMATKLVANSLFSRADAKYGTAGWDASGVALRVRSDPEIMAQLEPFMPATRWVA